MKISYLSYTDIGDRVQNEDSYLTKESNGLHCFVVADGLGGHDYGEAASQGVCRCVSEKFDSKVHLSNTFVKEIFLECQDWLLESQKELHREGKMRTTMTTLFLDDKNAYWGYVGDSRIYYFNKKQLVKRTQDHSVPQMLASMGEIKESEIRFHEDRSRLLKVMGVEWKSSQVEVEEPIPLTGNQQFLMCSDGFWEFITEEQMLYCLDEAEEPQRWLEDMLELIRRNSRNKERDNITAVLVWVHDN